MLMHMCVVETLAYMDLFVAMLGANCSLRRRWKKNPQKLYGDFCLMKLQNFLVSKNPLPKTDGRVTRPSVLRKRIRIDIHLKSSKINIDIVESLLLMSSTNHHCFQKNICFLVPKKNQIHRCFFFLIKKP